MKIIQCPCCGGAERPADNDSNVCRKCVATLVTVRPDGPIDTSFPLIPVIVAVFIMIGCSFYAAYICESVKAHQQAEKPCPK